jgi:hypothetical protein
VNLAVFARDTPTQEIAMAPAVISAVWGHPSVNPAVLVAGINAKIIIFGRVMTPVM